ncbi:H-type small acid-soluble spore protein [Desulfolucanica intricata]|uniref:H-type small acid-soluble spore protein n=1 Tax=Desulfolucanica intricata TaxID=1285191 RepID=UPI00082D5D74|nr:H-type small acid-soluble spore protein [Desulfolucanica intricata]
MNFERAQEIFNSPENIRVLHNGSPVWIERLNADNNTALVRMETSPGQKMSLPVSELTEG